MRVDANRKVAIEADREAGIAAALRRDGDLAVGLELQELEIFDPVGMLLREGDDLGRRRIAQHGRPGLPGEAESDDIIT